MALFDYFPYTNLHELNLDWIVRAIKGFIGEADKHFDTIDEEVLYLKENFVALEEYVNNYFDSLDLVSVVNDKLEEMLDDGTIQALLSRAIPEVASMTGDYIGKPVLRHRINRYANLSDISGKSYFFQNIAINGDYAYIIKTSSDDSETYLSSYSLLTNTLLYEDLVADYPHGGPLYIKDGLMYSICTKTNELFKWDLTNPAHPSLIGHTPTQLPDNSAIVGWNGANWIIKSGYGFYSCSSEFTNPSLLFTIDYKGVMQDIYLDPVTQLIYILTVQPQTIQVYDSIDGSLYTTMNIPNIINYIGVSEVEGIHVEDGSIYVGAGNVVGFNGSLKSEIIVFKMDLRNKIDYKAIYNMGGMREVRINYNMGACDFFFNPNTFVAVVKYIEDAQNLSKECNATYIEFDTDYPESFHIYANADYNFNNKNVGAIKVDEFVNCRIENFSKFTGNYFRFNGVSSQAQIYISYNAYCTFLNVPTTSVESGKYRVWCNRGTVKIEDPNIPNEIVNSFILVKATLLTAGLVGNYIMASKSIIICKALLRTASYNNQFISDDTVLLGRFRRSGSGDRWNLNTITQVAYPYQMMIKPNPASHNVITTINELPVYITSDTPTTINLKYYTTQTNSWVNVPITITRETNEVPAGVISRTEGFTYYLYSLTTEQSLPSLLCTAEFN